MHLPEPLTVKIMGFMKKDNHIDPDIYDLFIKYRIYYDYAIKEMAAEQIDIEETDEGVSTKS